MILHRRAAAWLVAAVLIVLPSGPDPARGAGDAPVVAAASNLQFALSRIAEEFQVDTGHYLRLSFGSSGNLARQIRQGAPTRFSFPLTRVTCETSRATASRAARA